MTHHYSRAENATAMHDNKQLKARPRVVIIGAGFGGLRAAKALQNAHVDVTILDRNNYHQFQPLLYQVATAGLEPESIASPVRALLHKAKHTSYQMTEVRGVDFASRSVLTDGEPVPYDYLVVSAGSATNFFGNAALEERTFGLKDLQEAVALRNQILWAFEQAVRERDPERRKALLTFVVVGGGPTGVELVGALTELIGHALSKDYPMLDMSQSRVILLEAMDRILAPFPASLQRSALKKLHQLKVDVRLNMAVTTVTADEVQLQNGEILPSYTVIWAAGVKAAALAAQLGLPTARAGRITVQPTLQVAAHPEVFVVGDMAYLEDAKGAPYPMVAPVAMQQGTQAGRNILALVAGGPLQPFAYFDRGSMAVIGRKAAVAWTFGLKLRGFIAWMAWLFVHLIYLVGFRNRVVVVMNWAYNYFTYDRGMRLLTDSRGAGAQREQHIAPVPQQAVGR